MLTHVLLIDDDQTECGLLERHLVQEGMAVRFAHDGRAGLQSALSGDYDLVIIDLTLPQLTGLDVIRQLRERSTIGILALIDQRNEMDTIVGLECGADDCLTRPLNPRELAARIRAISRRRTPWLTRDVAAAPEYLELGDLSLDGGSRTCRRNGEPIDLTTAEYDLLFTLLRCSGRAVPRKELLKRVLDREYSPFDRSIDVHVSNLRHKLPRLPDGMPRIRSVRNVGYMYVRPVKLACMSSGASEVSFEGQTRMKSLPTQVFRARTNDPCDRIVAQ
jgi:DNA-binding response OmpR family regulator